MAGVRPLTEEEKELILVYGKPVTVYNILQAYTRDNPHFLPRCLSYKIEAKKNKMENLGGITVFSFMNFNNIILKSQIVKKTSCPFCPTKCGSLEGVKYHLTSSHGLFDFNFRLSENGHPNIDVSVKPDAFKNGVLNYDIEEHNRVDFIYYRSKSRMRGQSVARKERKYCKIFEKYRDYVPRDKENELPHVNGDNITPTLARTRLSQRIRDIQAITQPEIGQCSKAKRPPPATRRKKLYPKRGVVAKRTDLLKIRQFHHSKTLQPMTLEEVLGDADSDNESDEDFKDQQERMNIDRLVDASDVEKRFMYLWNIFMRKNSVYVDKQVPRACEEFVKLHAKELNSTNLIWQWRSHAINTLWKHGLIDAKTIDKCSIILQNACGEANSAEAAPTAAEAAAAKAAAAAAAAAAMAAEATADAGAEKTADAAAAEKAAASTFSPRRSTRQHKKKKNQQEAAAASTSKANAKGNKPQPMELDEEEEH